MSIKTVPVGNFSLWQSAVEEVVKGKMATSSFPSTPARIDTSHPMVAAAGSHAGAAVSDAAATASLGAPAPSPQVAGNTPLDCSKMYLSLAQAKAALLFATSADQRSQLQQQVKTLEQRVAKFGTCDPGWAETVTKYLEYYKAIKDAEPPYIAWQNLGDFVIDSLPENARIGLIADWGTGLAAAENVLDELSTAAPDLVIHLGDIYYSGTDDEMDTCFYDICKSTLKDGTRVFALTGNHDMYSGGHGYYNLLQKLGQPASYFCLRNANWQFLALDTGLNDHDPFTVESKLTSLDPREVDWHLDKINNSGGRRTVLLSHHQPFSAFSKIAGQYVNQNLLDPFASVFDKIALWLWGHEHGLYVYGPYKAVQRGRCIGFGAIPVSIGDHPYQPLEGVDVPFDDTVVVDNDGTIYANGYAIMTLSGAKAEVVYYQVPDPNGRNPIFRETM